jgi:hypothetical protein
MVPIPFLISSDAAAFIVEMVRSGEEKGECAGFVPGLYLSLAEQSTDLDGNVFELRSEPAFRVGWFRPDQMIDNHWLELEISGKKLFASPDTLKALEGRRLIVERAEVGYPTPSDRKRKLLRAVPNEPDAQPN